MNMSDDDELTDAERHAIDALPAERGVPEGFEDRAVASLRARGLLAAAAPAATASPRRLVLRLGLAAGLFGSGLGTGLLAARRSGPAAQATAPLYLLLLYPGPRFVEGGAADEAARVAEYGAWAGRLHRASQLVSAEKLAAHARLLEGSALVDSPVPGPQGFFLIRARDLAEAEAIARECPHLRHGGRVSVQAVEG
jgi:hypothetical protein